MPATNITINSDDLVQSPHTYIQAVGSDGTDGSTTGIHLRWTFREGLGQNHLAKGDLASDPAYLATYGFNKPGDFVEVYRVPYVNIFPTTVDFENGIPDRVNELGATRIWEYDITVASITSQTIVNTVVVRFSDTAQYDVLRFSHDPFTNPWDLIQNYTGIIEAAVLNKLSFAVDFETNIAAGPGAGLIRLEAISDGDSNKVVTCRKKITIEPGQGGPSDDDDRPIVDDTVFMNPVGLGNKLLAENIEYIRFDFSDILPLRLHLETYHDFMIGVEEQTTNSWSFKGDYSLTLDDNEVDERLDKNSGGEVWNVDQNWPRFNTTGDIPSQGARVKIANYQSKWNVGVSTNDNLKYGVTQYLINSANASPDFPNPTGTFLIPADSDTSMTNTAQMPMNVLEMLNFVALDFHVARMLGLGTVDADNIGTQRYVYLMRYVTHFPLEPGNPFGTVQNYYMTLPTGISEQRYPEAPGLTLDYGLSVPALPDPIELSDPQGYAPFEPIRYVNLYKGPDAIDLSVFLDFFDVDNEFCLGDITPSVYHGLKYKKVNPIPPFEDWRWPELSNDSTYQGHDLPGTNEAMPVLAQAGQPLFIHDEREEGIHEYALYGINWFSRSSGVGLPVQTDFTQFQKFVTVLPPANLQVQLIQVENPRILTTAQEQADLAALNPSPDDNEIYVRATWEWDHTHNQAYQAADHFEFFFRQEEPDIIRGKILSTVDLPGNKVLLNIGSYVTVSSGDTVTPVITQPVSNFTGGIFTSAGEAFFVESLTTNGLGTLVETITLRKNEDTEQEEVPINSGNFVATQMFTSPVVGDQFMLIENISTETSWPGGLLNHKVQVINFLADLDENGNTITPETYKETVTLPDGSTAVQNVGGMVHVVDVTEVLDLDGTGTPIPGSTTGVYEITYTGDPTTVTGNEPPVNAEYFKGKVRIMDINGDERKVLTVINIRVDSGNMILTAMDNTYHTDGAPNYIPQGDYVPIETGPTVQVNFHPGYKSYLVAETGFDQAEILPPQGTGTRTTYMTIRATDFENDDPNDPIICASTIGTPVVLQARDIIIPLQPAAPSGPLFATRPDREGKSTYTVDVDFETPGVRVPFGMVFYRGDDQSILEQLYLPATIDQIRIDLANLPPDEAVFNQDRWNDLVNVVFDGGTLEFLTYHTTPGAGVYKFPTPDNNLFQIPDPRFGQTPINPFNGSTLPGDANIIAGTTDIVEGGYTMAQAIKAAILETFVPLTEEPLIYDKIPDGSPTKNQTSRRKPTIRDINGNRLAASDPAYDPYPMAVVIPDKGVAASVHAVRFSDYTIEGGSLLTYFYYAVEMSDNLTVSEPSQIAGPVRLVNTIPAPAPEVIKVLTQLENPIDGTPAAIRFELNPYMESENMKKVQLYRATNIEDSLSIQTMTPVYTNLLDITADIIDDFSEDDFTLFGENLFYRIVAYREILNEQDVIEYVPSNPSVVLMASLVDVINPPSPTVEYTHDGLTAIAPRSLTNVKLTWPKTAHNARYYLYKEATAGNWELIHEVASNDSTLFYNIGDLIKEDDESNIIYHRFRVEVENSSGLLSVNRNELTV